MINDERNVGTLAEALKLLGEALDSFCDIITELLYGEFRTILVIHLVIITIAWLIHMWIPV